MSTWPATAALVAVLLTGCGDDGDGAAPSATVAPADAGFCDAFGALLAGPLTEPGVDLGDPAGLETAVTLTDELLAATVEEAPPAVRTEAEALAAEYRAGFAVLARYGYDLARIDAEATPEDAATLGSFLAAPAGPGDADPVVALEDHFLDRCAPGVTVPPDLLTTTTSP